MKIIFDNIIYNLQNSGGGSVYWTELMKRFLQTDEDVIGVDQKEPHNNLFRDLVVFPRQLKETVLHLKVRRYLPFTISIREKAIFHSSLYRVSNSRNAINVTSVHDFTTEKFRRGLPAFVHHFQKRYALKRSDGIVCISENTKKDLLKFHPYVPEKKIRVIYNGASEDFFVLSNEEKIHFVEYEQLIPAQKKLIIFIGHRTSYKNFDIAVKTISMLSDAYHLLVIGEPLNNTEIELISGLLPKSKYTILSKIKNPALNYFYNIAFCLFYPSSYEGFGIPVVEAMKAGCPVVTTDRSSIPEVAGDAAIMVTEIKEEAFVKAVVSLEEASFRLHLINLGFEQSRKFKWDTAFEQYYQFYKDLYHAG